MKKWMDRYGIYLWAWLLVSVTVSCTDDRGVFGEYRPSEVIAFTASLNDDVQAVVGRGVSSYLSIEEEEWPLESAEQTKDSRGAVVSALSGLNVGVYGYTTSDNAEVFDNASFTFVYNEDLLPDNNPKAWSTIEGKPLKVFAYAPKMSLSDWTPSASPAIAYTVPTEVSEQKDIIASDVKEVAANYNQYIPLTFKHVLTGIRFKVWEGCKVTSLKVEGVYGTGTYTLGETWSNQSEPTSFTLNDIASENNTLMMIPQLLPEGAQVILTYEGGTRVASLAGLKWEPGKLITYTINKEEVKPEYIYFDLNAGNVNITPTSYSGKVFVSGVATDVTSGEEPVDISALKFYVYQSTEANKATTGWETKLNTGICRVPQYAPVKVGNKFWSEFITNNDNVESVIEAWDTESDQGVDKGEGGTYSNQGAVRKVNRTSTGNYIEIIGIHGGNALVCDLTIDNLYSRHQPRGATRLGGGILFWPKTDYSKLTVNLIGDNRFGNIHYYSGRKGNDESENAGDLLMNNQLVIQGSGSLTAACVDFYKGTSAQSSGAEYHADNVYGYFSNYWCSAIGGDDGSHGNAVGIVIKGGTIYAGTTQAENCTALGAGGNDKGYVTIEGGTVTAVAATTGTAIGGGIGFNSQGGYGNVKITSGNVYAYNHANEWEIPSAAIGSAGSSAKYGGAGTVNISGDAYVYAQTALGTAIGGGSSKTQHGGNATINISGNCYVVAKSIAAIDKKTGVEYPAGNGIGGGTGGVGKASDTDSNPAYGGSATVTISGNPTIRTGSIGGGKTNNPDGKIGSATITVEGGDILGQFVMAGGAGEGKTSSFTMSGTNTVISNSDVDDKEYYHVQRNGGAVYMEDGTFTMTGGTIKNCTAETGGAVYIKRSANALQDPQFIMSGGMIEDCVSEAHGGAVYLEVGEVKLSGDAIIQRNLAQSGNGGAVYITAGNFFMGDGNPKVLYNSAQGKNSETLGNGGGIYVTSQSTEVNVEVLSGEIKNNTSDGNGGGVCVDMPSEGVDAFIKIGEDGSSNMINPDIQSNESVMYGGGLYAKGRNAKITINGGVIMNNSVSNYVPNENVYNDMGTVTLNGGDVTHVVVTFDANAPEDDTALLDGGKTATQKIVKDTNSFLVQPTSIIRNFYNFDSWNTRPDGNGTKYSNGDIMNLKENLTLYAQWKSQTGT